MNLLPQDTVLKTLVPGDCTNPMPQEAVICGLNTEGMVIMIWVQYCRCVVVALAMKPQRSVYKALA